MSLYLALRWIHVLAGAAWFGEVVTLNLVLVPALTHMAPADRTRTLAKVFPKVSRLASWLSATAVAAGLGLLVMRFGGQWEQLWTTTTGRALGLGATLATLLTAFHFILEPRLEGMICNAAERQDFEATDQILRKMRIAPRIGMAVITTVVVCMMVGARGY